MMSRQGLEFKDISSRKTAVFVTVSDTDRAMDTLVNIFFTQAMNELCQYADNCCENGRLPIPVRFILDDFATNCRIDEFPRMISSIRSRAISVMMMIQSEAQLRQGYDDDAQTIISNCDTYVYLVGNDVQTAQAVSERCDKQLSEVLYMPVGSCWVFRRGSKPKYAQQTDISDIHREIGK
jgi:type IV secretion system protein VirD4